MVKAAEKNTIDKKHILDEDEKLLLCNDIELRNSILVKKNKNNYYKFSIPMLFKKYNSGNLAEILAEKDFNDIIKKNIPYNCDISLLRIIPEFVYNYFLNKKYSDINSDCFEDNSNDFIDNVNFNYMDYSNDDKIKCNNKDNNFTNKNNCNADITDMNDKNEICNDDDNNKLIVIKVKKLLILKRIIPIM